MYRGIVSRNKGSIKIVDLQTKSKPLEYGVKILDIPQKFRMDYLIKVDSVSLETIDKLTRILVLGRMPDCKINEYTSPICPSPISQLF